MRGAHWFIPAALAVFAFFAFAAAPSAEGPLGTATSQSIGYVFLAALCAGAAAGYCIGRLTAARRSP